MRIRALLRRPEAALIAMAFAAYAYFYQAGGWNQNVRFDLVRSLVEQRSTSIDKTHRNTGDKSCRGNKGKCRRALRINDDHFYCDKAPGVSMLGAPSYAVFWAVFRAVAGTDRPSKRYLVAGSYVSTLVSIALPSAISVGIMFWILGLLGVGRRGRVALSLGYGFSTIGFPYSTLLYGHQLAAALLIAGFAILVKARREPASRPPLWLAGVLLGFSVVSEYPAALAVLPITVYAAVFIRPWNRLVGFAVAAAACAALLGAYHTVAFGGPLTLPYEFSTQKFRGLGYFMGLGAPNWQAFSNTMFTSYRGLFFSAPWLLLAFPGAVVAWRKGYRAETAVSLSVVLLFVWMVSSLLESWHGGWSLGSRYMIPAIPFLVVLAGGLTLLDRRPSSPRGTWLRRGVWGVAIASLAYSGLLMLAGTAVRPEVPQHIKKPFAQYLMPHFYAGKLSVNPQHINRIDSPRNGKAEAWNLGQLLGLKGLLSLLPLALLLLAGAVWLRAGVLQLEAGEVGTQAAPRAPPT